MVLPTGFLAVGEVLLGCDLTQKCGVFLPSSKGLHQRSTIKMHPNSDGKYKQDQFSTYSFSRLHPVVVNYTGRYRHHNTCHVVFRNVFDLSTEQFHKGIEDCE